MDPGSAVSGGSGLLVVDPVEGDRPVRSPPAQTRFRHSGSTVALHTKHGFGVFSHVAPWLA